MCLRRISSGSVVIVVVAGMLVPHQTLGADEERPDWWQAQCDITATLLAPQANIGELAGRIATSPPRNGHDAMLKLCILMRAGMTAEAVDALRELKSLCPRMDNGQVARIYCEACDHFQAWGVAKATVEVFAENVSDIPWSNRLLKHFLETGWTVGQVDAWLAAMPRGRADFWVKERLRFGLEHGCGDALLERLSDEVRSNPQDTTSVITFLDILAYAKPHVAGWQPDLGWMVECVKPTLATHAYDLASRLMNLGDWAGAALFHQLAIEMSLADDEVRDLSARYQLRVTPASMRAIFAVQAREGMAECQLQLGRELEAQKWLEAATDIRDEHNLGRNAVLAGRIQGASGARVIEGWIQEDAPLSKDDPQYWRERALYYCGRGEVAREEEAWKRGLALTMAAEASERLAKSHADWRNWLLSSYALFLKRENRVEEAVTLLRSEITQAPVTSVSSQGAANLLAFDFREQVRVDDPVLWRWLAARPTWEHTEQRLLWRMLENAEGEDLDAHLSDAESLAFEGDPTRAHTLGWIMNRMSFPERSIPLLERAVRDTDDVSLKNRAASTLFESYLDAGHWRSAERLFPDAAVGLTSTETPRWYARITVLAAKHGATDDAMRIWKRVANLSPSQTHGLSALAEAGLRDDLLTFYRQMQTKMPSSDFVARAVESLESQEPR